MSNKIKHVPYVLKTDGSISMYLNGETMTVENDHPNFTKIVDALKAGKFDNIDLLVNISRAVISYTGNQVQVKDGQIYFGQTALHNTLTARVIAMMNEGFKFDHMLKFLENMLANPSRRSIDETYTFLENHGLPITDDGCFLAYKAVRNNYTDIHTGTFDNHIGKSPVMLRGLVDDNYEADCSNGLHCGSLGYVIEFGHFVKGQSVGESGNRLLIVKVNPKDVVSVPKYADHTKMRVSTYTVVSEIKDVVKELEKVVYTSSATVLAPDRDEDDFEDDFEDDYNAGWGDGITARDDGEAYGFGRKNHTPKSNYSNGYNDAYNGRPYDSAYNWRPYDSDTDDEDVESYTTDWTETEYLRGVEAGQADWENDIEFSPCSYESTYFLDGYRSGYNGKE